MACGGVVVTEAFVHSALITSHFFAQFYQTMGQEMELKEVVFSQNKLLDFDQKSVSNAICNANIINVYFHAKHGSKSICSLTFEVNLQGSVISAEASGLNSYGACRSATGAVKGVR